MSKDEGRQMLKEKGEHIVRHLSAITPTTWDANVGELDNFTPMLVLEAHDSGRAIRLDLYADDGGWRVEVRGEYPRWGNSSLGVDAARKLARQKGYEARPPSITMALDRSPKSLAKGIMRRFLEEYNATHDLAMALKHERDVDRQACEQAERELAELFGDAASRKSATSRGSDQSFGLRLYYDDGMFGEVDIMDNGDSVRMDLRDVPLDMAKAIAAKVRAERDYAEAKAQS